MFQVCCLHYIHQVEGLKSLGTVFIGFLHTMIGWYLKRVDPVLACVWRVSTEKSTHDFLNWEVKKDAWIHEFHKEVSFLGISL